MRTFHTGGVAGEDITQGLPRAEELFEARKTIKSGEAGLSPLDGYVTDITTTATGEDQVEVTGDLRTARIPSALVKAEEGDEIDAKELIDAASPCTGEVVLVDVAKGGQELFAIDVANGDRSYSLPPVARPKVETGDRISEGDPLTERFNVEGITADRRGTVRLSEEKDRVVELVDEDGAAVEHEIPYGARLMVEPGTIVQEGDQITSRSKPIFIAAEGEGVAQVLPDRIVVYNPDGLALRIPLTSDLKPLKRHGDPVKAGEQLVALDISHEGLVRVDSIEKRRGIATVHLQPKSVVKIDKAVTVRIGDKVEEGDLLTKGVVAPHTLLEAAGVQKARQYLMNEIHKVYKQQGVDINDKHLEVIIRQILNNVRIVDRGDSRFLIGDLVTLEEFRKEIRDLVEWNEEAARGRTEAIGSELAEDIAAGGHIIATAGAPLTEEAIARAKRMGLELVRVHRDDEIVEVPIAEKRLPDGERELLRISKAALQTKGWLSAASFQRTTKVLSEAALRGEVDDLSGLKPSIIVGKRIPSGTGFNFYERPETAEEDVDEALEPDGEPIAVGEENTE